VAKSNMSSDISGAMAVMGSIDGMCTTVSTNNFKSAVIKHAHHEMSKQFNSTVDIIASTNPESLHHVYEWRMVGIPAGRLWKNTLKGHGGSRVASFEFKASRTPILTPMERRRNRSDPISMVPMQVLQKLSTRAYIFYWKAPVMEYNYPVTILPKYGQKIFVPTGKFDKNGKAYVFSDSAQVANPGGSKTTGAFTQLYATWWTAEAPGVFDSIVKKSVEKDLRNSVEIATAKNVRKRRKTFSLGLDSMANFKTAKDDAMYFLDDKARQMQSKSNDGEDYW